MQPAMRDRQAQEIGMQAHHAISKMASISTATPRGKAGTETAARAWRSVAEDLDHQVRAAIDHLAGSVNLGVELTKPPSRTTRFTRSSDPSAALACASSASPQPRAASAPASTAIGVPAGPFSGLICPET